MGETVLRLVEISKRFDTVKAVDSLSLQVQKGEVATLLGPSGCGKTTTLRLVAGLEEPDTGEIYYRDKLIVSVKERLFSPPYKRDMGMVFQSYALWPNMTVARNVAFPLELRGMPAKVIREKVSRALELVNLCRLEERPAPLLSGGQAQRVALARALVYEPELLLLDEPFSNLDAKLREQMRVELKLLQKKLGISVLFVTHDQIEAMSLSDRVAVMNEGGIEQIGPPWELYEKPQTPFVRDFLGKTIILRGTVDSQREGWTRVKIKGTSRHLTCSDHTTAGVNPGQEVCVAIRPEDILPHAAFKEEENALRGIVETCLFVGDRYEIHLRLESGDLIFFYLPRTVRWKEGEEARVKFPRERISLWGT